MTPSPKPRADLAVHIPPALAAPAAVGHAKECRRAAWACANTVDHHHHHHYHQASAEHHQFVGGATLPILTLSPC